MSNFIFINRNENYKSILKQVLDNPDDWKAVHGYANISGKLQPSGFLPLVMGVLAPPYKSIKDSELQRPTEMYYKYTEIRKWLRSYNIKQISRAAFFGLPVGGCVKAHVDDGKYYLSRDRFHLSLQGKYSYRVGDETHIIEPGTFFWFNNKIEHESKNVSDVERITFVFDVIHSKKNPQHRVIIPS